MYIGGEVIMTQANQPTKYVIRKYLERRSQEKTPPPSLEQIRQQLGWGLIFVPLRTPSSGV